MDNDKKITEIMNKNGVDLFGTASFGDCLPANRRLYEECADMKTVIVFAVPYRTKNVPDDGMRMSAYARVYDYHGYFRRLFDSLVNDFKAGFPACTFKGYADHSPINERHAASLCSLGVIGRNSLLITEKYGSYVFLGSIITDLVTETSHDAPKSCMNCGKCVSACPGGALRGGVFAAENCVSAISQKKVINEDEEKIIAANKAVWGCDVCQQVCPMNEGALFTDNEYFTGSYLKNVSSETISEMTDEEFAKYPFSWRKKEVILRNLRLAEENEK